MADTSKIPLVSSEILLYISYYILREIASWGNDETRN